jgi:hypothetical protein
MEPAREQIGIYEGDLALELGLTRETMASLRREHLQEGVDWTLNAKKVWLVPAAAERLKAQLGCPDLPAGKNGHGEAPGAKAEPVELVVRLIPRNIHIVVCEKKEDGDRGDFGAGLVRVRVRSNANFLPGMQIRAMPHPDYSDVFDLVGRCPRQRGRW